METKYYAVVMSNSNDALAHHGVKGMRWGVRKAYDYVRKHIGSSAQIGSAVAQTVYARNHLKNMKTKYGKDKAYTAKIDKRVAKAKAYLTKKGQKANKKYTTAQMAMDYQLYGKRGVKRINKKMNKGKSWQKAGIKEYNRLNRRVGAAAYVGAHHKEIINGAKTVAKLGYDYYKYKTQNGGRIGIEQNPDHGKTVYDTTYREVSSKRKKRK